VIFDRFVGIPWVNRGRSIVGCDCWGLVWMVYRDLRGIELPSYSDRYVTAKDRDAIAALIAGEIDPWDEIPAGQEMPFDAALMHESGIVRHIGIVTAPGRLLHVERGETSRIERYREGVLLHRLSGFYRYRGDTGSGDLGSGS
jgi:cell wall-associated NlpC family hydrolase